MPALPREPVVVCLGFPVFQSPAFVERLRAIAGVEPVLLPIDPDGDSGPGFAGEPHDEPPPWARRVAAERREVFARTEVLLGLHAPRGLDSLAPRLRWIQGIGAGVEQFARAGARRDRVVLTNASGVSAASMAEWVVGRLLQVWKRFREADVFQQRHEFGRTHGRSFAGSTIGIVGFGSIGQAVAERLRPFGCRVLGLRRSHRPGDRSELADALYGPGDLHEMLALCDAVVVAAPATPQTHHLIDGAALAAMPPHAVLVNVARGWLVDETALGAALVDGSLAAAVLDVFEREPLPPESPLWEIPSAYLSAHSSVSIDRYMEDVFELFLDNLARYRAGEPLRNRVDMEALGFAAG